MSSSWDPRGGGPRWDAPVKILQGDNAPVREAPCDSGDWGRTDTILVGANKSRHTMLRVHLQESQPVEITGQVLVAPGTATLLVGGTILLYAWLEITWGNGVASVTRQFRFDDRMDTCVVGSWFQAVAYIGDINGNPIALGSLNAAGQATPPSMQVSVFAAKGIRGLPYVSTQRLTGSGVSGVLSTSPKELFDFHGHVNASGGAAPLFLQLFDSAAAPAANAVPVEEYALSVVVGAPDAGERYINPFPFSQGVAWGVSTTSGQFVAAATGAFVTAEILRM